MAVFTTLGEWEDAPDADEGTMIATGVVGDISLVPRARLGALLVEYRRRAGRSLDEMAARSSGLVDVALLREIEHGRVSLGDKDLRTVVALYGASTTQLLPQRSQLVLDREERRIRVGESSRRLPPGAPDRDVLVRYLALVYALRNIKPGRFFVPRHEDLEVLRRAMVETSPAVETLRRSLEHLMQDARHEIATLEKHLARRPIVPAIGVLVAVCVGGSLVLAPSDGKDANPVAASRGSATASSRTARSSRAAGDAAQVGPGYSTERPSVSTLPFSPLDVHLD